MRRSARPSSSLLSVLALIAVIGEKKDYKQEVLSADCTNCEAECFVPSEGEKKNLIAEDKGAAANRSARAHRRRKKHRFVHVLNKIPFGEK